MKRININPIFHVGEVVVKSGVRPDSYSNSWKQDKSKAEETSIIGTDHALRGKHHLFFFIPTIYLCFEEISFCMEFKNQDLKACVKTKKSKFGFKQ